MGLAATFAYLAIIGILGWRAWHGSDTEKVMFVVNVMLLWLSAIWLFGYPALIGPAVVGAGGFLLFLVVITSSDLRMPVAARTQDASTAPAEPVKADSQAVKRSDKTPASRTAGKPVRSATASS
ncbi:MAG: hypothetical protein KUA43_01185 [Hoeflea sp.]|uniref:hypothetical protein n=1 Tax=Hoeflea sp. TaxID=1940281 RepID=UPI001DF4DCEB|nr:hypothetical protein [Hoeflea sp.]MBU4530450.1 hypothetical protein [Alphaproteobacteria bacterium]MBU4545237.1 hypothetical protein [Alphaproteobacteria bacterium]MBU4549563.1 hypothetical protein [Alphaproteobacteria bacterium]MBV1722040.1 hypothetical protein [Hoeflea sp.]MBV1761390.1 hypothetical protein [Hoeflea sp.]